MIDPDSGQARTTPLPPPGKPGVPALLSPANGVLLSGYLPTLDWKDAAAADHYRVQVSRNSSFKTTLVDQYPAGSTYTLTTALAANTTWYWRVRTYNGLGQASAWSSVRSFRTKLSAPVGISPLGGVTVTGLKPVFKWSKVSGASGYTLQVARDAAFTSFVFKRSIPAVTAYSSPLKLPAHTTLYWRVRTNGTNGPGDWMPYETFLTP